MSDLESMNMLCFASYRGLSAEFINIGVVLYCKDCSYLAVKTRLDETRIMALYEQTDYEELLNYIAAFHPRTNGDQRGGPIAELDQASRVLGGLPLKEYHCTNFGHS